MVRGLMLGTALVLTAPPAGAQQDLRVEGDWTHAPTGMVFPERLGNALRTRIHLFDAEGMDVSAGYAVRKGGDLGLVTLYVYPAPPERDCAANFAEIERNVASTYADVKRLESDRWPSPSGRAPGSGYHARFSLTGTLEGKEQPLVSESYLFCPAGGNWLVAARASWARDSDLHQSFVDFLKALPWPARLDTPAE